jgi:hypothetical protein
MAKKDTLFIANPTRHDVEAGGVTAGAGEVVLVDVEDEGTETLAELVCAGCTVAPALLVNKSGEVAEADALVASTGGTDTALRVAEAGGTLLAALARNVVSVAGDTHAEVGV